jgi:hypothetical protein
MAASIEKFIIELSFMQRLEHWNLIIEKVYDELNNLLYNSTKSISNEKLNLELLQILILGNAC